MSGFLCYRFKVAALAVSGLLGFSASSASLAEGLKLAPAVAALIAGPDSAQGLLPQSANYSDGSQISDASASNSNGLYTYVMASGLGTANASITLLARVIGPHAASVPLNVTGSIYAIITSTAVRYVGANAHIEIVDQNTNATLYSYYVCYSCSQQGADLNDVFNVTAGHVFSVAIVSGAIGGGTSSYNPTLCLDCFGIANVSGFEMKIDPAFLAAHAEYRLETSSGLAPQG